MMASIDAHRDDEIKYAIKCVHENSFGLYGACKQACGGITRPALTDKIVMGISSPEIALRTIRWIPRAAISLTRKFKLFLGPPLSDLVEQILCTTQVCGMLFAGHGREYGFQLSYGLFPPALICQLHRQR